MRTPGDALGPAPRNKKSKKTSAPDKDGLERVLKAAQQRMREIQEHYPRGLMLSLNGQVIAVRDLNSHWAQLKVETNSIKAADIVEVISDQGLPLLTFPVCQTPPQSAPEVRHEVALSRGRTVGLVLRFTADGALIEITYDNPSFADEPIRHFVGSHSALERSLHDETAYTPFQRPFLHPQMQKKTVVAVHTQSSRLVPAAQASCSFISSPSPDVREWRHLVARFWPSLPGKGKRFASTRSCLG
jgi:hypothetical protein